MITGAAVLGFVGQLRDMEDQVRLCRPILSFGTDDSNLFLARHFEWAHEERRLKRVNRAELWRFGTALAPNQRLTIRSGAGVAVMGKEFVRNTLAANLMDVRPLAFRQPPGLDCRIGICGPSEFDDYVTQLVRRAQHVFDQGLSSHDGPGALSAASSAALFVLKQAPVRWCLDTALRVLAGLRVQTQTEANYRDLRAYFATFLKTEEASLEQLVSDHLATCQSTKDAAKKLGVLTTCYPELRERWGDYEYVHATKAHLFREKPAFLHSASDRCPHADQDYWPPKRSLTHSLNATA